MFDAERLLGQLLEGSLSGRIGSRHRRRHHGAGRAFTSVQGLTLLGGIAIAAWEHFQQKGSMASVAPPPVPAIPMPPADRARLLLEAMIQAAKCDGAVDDAERARIVASSGDPSDDARAWLDAEIAKPADLDGLTARVKDPGLAHEMYAACYAVTAGDTATERAWLSLLAGRLGIDSALAAAIERQVNESENRKNDAQEETK